MSIGSSDIRAAAARMEGRLVRTPLLASQTLSRLTGVEVFIKFENYQFTGSFKDRGALNRLLTLDASARERGVCAMSAGNHAQGVAWNAQRLGIAATIVMPRGAPLTKIEHTRDFGAEVVIAGDTLEEAAAEARRITQERGLTFVHPYDDPLVVAGQGTVGLEIIEEADDLDAIICSVGGGGLVAGVATVAKDLRPDVKVYGVQAASHASLVKGVVSTGASTIADGIAVKAPGALTSRIIAERVEDVVAVSEEAIERAVALLITVEKTVAEGAGAAPLACLLEHGERFAGRRVALVLSGGNIDSRLLSSVLLRELVREHRIVTLQVCVVDQPGFLAKVATIIADADANIIDVDHYRSILSSPAREANVAFKLETRGPEHAGDVVARLRAAGYEAALAA